MQVEVTNRTSLILWLCFILDICILNDIISIFIPRLFRIFSTKKLFDYIYKKKTCNKVYWNGSFGWLHIYCDACDESQTCHQLGNVYMYVKDITRKCLMKLMLKCSCMHDAILRISYELGFECVSMTFRHQCHLFVFSPIPIRSSFFLWGLVVSIW